MTLLDRPEYGDEARAPLLPLVPPGTQRILDVGCNRGAFGLAIKNMRGAEVWGVEPDQACADVARARLDRVIVDVFRAENPIPDGYFDLVTFNDSLEHMADPTAALVLARAKLGAGGQLLCCVPNVRYVENLEHLLFEKDFRYEMSGIRDQTHLRFFTEKSIVRLVQDNGFEVASVTGINAEWWSSEHRLRRIVFRLLPEFTRDMKCKQIVVLARR
jgi:2-polyprenyl-3-methyl-5-hydroxy-6-metoxy-1,4-benzoquinol methylase